MSNEVIEKFLISQLFKKPFFSQCEVDNILVLQGRYSTVNDGIDYKTLCAMHLVSWADMPVDVKASVKQLVYKLLGVPNGDS